MLQDQVDVWLIEINQQNYHKALDESHSLSDLEITKCNGFIFDRDKKSYLVSHFALRIILGKYLGRSPELIYYQFNSYGKPSINDSNLHFNLSHSGDLACITVAATEVGVDIEKVIEDFDYFEIANSYFTYEEISLINFQKNKLTQAKMFFKIWTIKESLLKAIGTGLVIDLPIVQLRENKWECISEEYNNNWQIADLKLLNENYIGTLAYKYTKSLTINYNNYSPHLVCQ